MVIPAYNEAQVLGVCLDTLAKQTVRHEAVVVDDGSTDATTSVAESRNVRVIRSDHAGPGLARNRGAAATSAPILVFLDADMTFAPDFLERLVEPIRKQGVLGTFTRDELVANGSNRWARFVNPSLRRMPANHGDSSQVFRAIQRAAFDSVGGYDDIGCGEDTTLAEKLGVLAVRAEGAVCWHRNPETAGEVFASARWYGKSDLVPHTRRNWVRFSPPIAVPRACLTGLRERSFWFALYCLIRDSGTFAGFVDRALGRHHSR